MGTALDAAASGDLEAAAAVFAALASVRRLQLLERLPSTTTALRAVLMVEPAEDLRLLERAGLIVRGAGVGGSVQWRPVPDLAARVAALL